MGMGGPGAGVTALCLEGKWEIMFSEPIKLGLLELSAVRELANIGLGHATTALATMTGKSYNMTVPYAESVALTALPRMLGDEELYAGIYMQVDGDIGGHMAFLFSWDSAKNLWKSLLGMSPDSPEAIGDLEASALIEVGNIINGSFLNAIASMTNFSMLATPPSLAIDMSIVILDTIVANASMDDHVALAIETEIFDEDNSTKGMFLYIPTVEGLNKLFGALGIQEAA